MLYWGDSTRLFENAQIQSGTLQFSKKAMQGQLLNYCCDFNLFWQAEAGSNRDSIVHCAHLRHICTNLADSMHLNYDLMYGQAASLPLRRSPPICLQPDMQQQTRDDKNITGERPSNEISWRKVKCTLPGDQQGINSLTYRSMQFFIAVVNYFCQFSLSFNPK